MANALLAAGCSPAMAHALDEVSLCVVRSSNAVGHAVAGWSAQ
jgi:hydroxyethylthiazole kinase-like sugar kinase family protein